jgi:hypothetical protein
MLRHKATRYLTSGTRRARTWNEGDAGVEYLGILAVQRGSLDTGLVRDENVIIDRRDAVTWMNALARI